MAIDSVIGNSRDSGELIRQKRMQDERAADIKAAEQRRQVETERLVEARENQLQDLYESSNQDIAAKRAESENRIQVAKSMSEQRAKMFEAEASRLTEDAKKQFQVKATQLQKSASELESQRTALLKQHDSAMERIRGNTLNTQAEAMQRGARESAIAHIQQTNRINDINEKGEYEAARVQDTIEDRKRTIVNEGSRKLSALETAAEENRAQISKSIEFDHREGAEQLARERQNLTNNQQRLEIEADERASHLSLENQRAINHQVTTGNRKLMEVQNANSHEISDAQKHARAQLQELQTRSAYSMNTLADQAQSQEDLARRGYEQQRIILAASRSQAIENSGKVNAELQRKLNDEYETRGKSYTALKDKTLITQMANDDQEIKFHRDIGKAQINETISKNAERVATHDARAADAFYRVHTINARVDDREGEYFIQMTVPPHEQENVRLSLQKNSITMSGTRRFDNKVKLEEGHSATTSAYQSYTESFPVRGKLDMANMTREYADGTLTIRIPKS